MAVGLEEHLRDGRPIVPWCSTATLAAWSVSSLPTRPPGVGIVSVDELNLYMFDYIDIGSEIKHDALGAGHLHQSLAPRPEHPHAHDHDFMHRNLGLAH